MRNPFSDDVFAGDGTGQSASAQFQAEALEALGQTMPGQGGSMGRALVLTAPRAGFGKTHLVTRFADGLAGRAFVVPLGFDLEKPPRWTSVLWEVVEKLHDHGHRSGLTLLDEAARFLFARVNQRLIQERKIPCAYPAEAVAALDRNYLEMFDFTNPAQAVARWFGEHFENLAPLTSASLAPEAQVDAASAGFWLRVLVSYSQQAGEPPEKRLEALRWAVNTSSGAALGGGGGMAIIQESGASPDQAAKDKLRDLGRLLGLYRPVVFVVDHLDVFYRDGQAGLRIAYFISELRRLLPQSLSVVSVNQDVWQATFQSQLPSALEDRLTAGFVPLRGLTLSEAAELVESRLGEAGVRADEAAAFRSRLHLGDLFATQAGLPVSPRAVLRFAAERWGRRAGILPPASVPVPPASVQVAEIPEGGLGVQVDDAVTGSTGDEPLIPASSVVGEDTLDSISAALQAMTGPEIPLAASVSAVTEGQEAFQRLKQRLERLRPAAVETTEFSPEARPNGHAAANPLTAAFTERLRRRSSGPVAPALDLERLGGLLRFAGQNFPVVQAAELSVPGTSGTALQWLSPDAEILVGLEPPTRPIFWSALTAHAAARVRLNGGLPVKVVAFTDHAALPHPAVQPGLPSGFTLDLVEPTASDLAELAAAGDVLVEVENGRLAAAPNDLSALLVSELDAFWRRLTRLSPASTS